ncbi:unnamed protein product [Spirodela intermedia]|uniref:Uncharacterized protein n=1 Tax=Spirodela intermedia TaxID=51605 RepID=A0ABN7EBJ1_SPIIN|nr:unnamed protein product [Spirodela intermedia]
MTLHTIFYHLSIDPLNLTNPSFTSWSLLNSTIHT